MHKIFALQCRSPAFPKIDFRLTSGVFVLGRSTKSDLVVKDPTVSRQHATIVVSKDTVNIRDMASRNGCFINDRRVAQGDVSGKDRIRFGDVPFLLAAWATENAASESETQTAGKPRPVSAPYFGAEAKLSEAQNRVFALALEGLSEKQIACRLHSSQRTIHNHIQAIYRVFNVHSRSELLAAIIRSTIESADLTIRP
jgi:DNA-binding CsgD family transcriptional regulator